MIEKIIRERKIKLVDVNTFEPSLIELKGELNFVVRDRVDMKSDEGNPMFYIPVDVFEDGVLLGTVKLGERTYKGNTSYPVAFSLPESIAVVEVT